MKLLSLTPSRLDNLADALRIQLGDAFQAYKNHDLMHGTVELILQPEVVNNPHVRNALSMSGFYQVRRHD